MVQRTLLLAAVMVACGVAPATARVVGTDGTSAVVLEPARKGAVVAAVGAAGARTPLAVLREIPRRAWAAGGRLALIEERSLCEGEACRYVDSLTLRPLADGAPVTAWSCEAGDRPAAPPAALGDRHAAVAAAPDCSPSGRIEVFDAAAPGAGTVAVVEAGGTVLALDTAGPLVAYATRERVGVWDTDAGATVAEFPVAVRAGRIAVGMDGSVAVLEHRSGDQPCGARLLIRDAGATEARPAGTACRWGLDVDAAGRPLAVHRVGDSFGILARHGRASRPVPVSWLTLGPRSRAPSPAPSFAAGPDTTALLAPGCDGPVLSVLGADATAAALPDVAAGCPVRLRDVTLLPQAGGAVRAVVAAECPRGCRGVAVLPDGTRRPLRLAAGERRLLRVDVRCRPGRTVSFAVAPQNGLPADSAAPCTAVADVPGTDRRPCARSAGMLPSWARARRMTVLNDSVLLSGKEAILRGFPCWQVRFIGRPALMLRVAEQEIRSSGMRVAPLVVIGIGYNSLWERNRRNYARWAARFDGEANRLLATLRAAGAEQFVWVTLRHVTAANSPNSTWHELGLYRWYFPYVNERLQRLDEKRRRLVLARWDVTGSKPGLTYDSIHLTAGGGRLMQELIETTIHREAVRQAELVPAVQPSP